MTWEASIDSNDCRELSKRCVALANCAPDGAQSTLFELAAGWLRLATDLDADPMFRERVREVQIFPLVDG